MPQTKIRVFWDLESCAPPTSSYTSPWEMLKDLRLFTSHFGIVTTIKAYWDSNNKSSINNEASNFRATTSSMGVDMIDCSLTQGYSRDAVTRRLTVDVLISVVDEPDSGTTTKDDTIIMVLSGDDSILYPISLLMFRNYTVFLVVPDQNDTVQAFQATRIFKWPGDVLGLKLKQTSKVLDAPRLVPDDESDQQVIQERISVALATSTTSAAVSPVHSPPQSRTIPFVTSFTSAMVPRKNEEPSTAATTPSQPQSAADFPATSSSIGSHVKHGIHPSRIAQFSASGLATHNQAGGTVWDIGIGDWVNMVGRWDSANANWDTGNWGAIDNVTDPYEPSSSNQRGIGRAAGAVELQERVKEILTSAFDPLLEILRGARGRTMGRSILGQELAKKKDIYQNAGVKSFSEYISLARASGLVILGGFGNSQYVRLHHKWKNVQ